MSQAGSARTTGDSVPGSGVQFGSGTPRSSSRMPATGIHSSAAKEKKRKDHAFRRHLNEKPSVIPGCPGPAVIPVLAKTSSI